MNKMQKKYLFDILHIFPHYDNLSCFSFCMTKNDDYEKKSLMQNKLVDAVKGIFIQQPTELF